MKKQVVAAGFVLFSVILPLKATAANVSFSELYVFGDSLSDEGNASKLTGGLFPPSPLPPQTSPYSQGRFSNGDLWVSYLGKELGLKPTLAADLNTTIPTQGINFAVAGATSGLENAFTPNSSSPTGVLAQIGQFTQILQGNNQKANPTALYTLWAGGNDYLFGNLPITNVVNNIKQSVNTLADAGAKNILVFNLANLGSVPAINGNPQLAAAYNNLTSVHNFQLQSTLADLQKTRGINLISVDVNSLFNNVTNNPESFGLTNTTAACLIGSNDDIRNGNFQVCDKPNEYLFFDSVHPTTEGHRLIAQAAVSAIEAKAVPEPSTVLGSLVVGAWGVALRKRQRQKAGRVLSAPSSRTME